MSQSGLYVGVDLGGTNIKIGLVNCGGEIISRCSIPTDEPAGPQAAVDRCAEAIDRLVEQAEVSKGDLIGLGLATPGTMDIPKGMLLEPPNLPNWSQFPIRDALAKRVELPVEYANDGTAAAYGEFWVGSGQEMESMIFLTLGTGVGCGIILSQVNREGEALAEPNAGSTAQQELRPPTELGPPVTLLHGVNSHGAECGHLVVDYSPDARICGCGRPGHLEAYASATGVVKRTSDGLAAGRSSVLTDRIDDDNQLSARLVGEAAADGDEFACEIVLETAMYLGRGIADLIHTIDPSGVVIGGAMTFGGESSLLGQEFLDEIRRVARGKIFPVLAERTRIDFARLGSDAGLVGAAGIARQFLGS